MSKHNYTQYSNRRNEDRPNGRPEIKPEVAADPVVNPKPVVEYEASIVEVAPEIELVTETVETVALPKTVAGVVANCAKLNVRAEPSIAADIVCVLDAMSEIEIDVDNSSREWFKVCTATGVDGYCMRKFVEAHL